jgi:hypothetical protein
MKGMAMAVERAGGSEMAVISIANAKGILRQRQCHRGLSGFIDLCRARDALIALAAGMPAWAASLILARGAFRFS